ncbi:hypothetical protein EMIHUDRAFT_229246 [Emiliania huxleyi CCMP1516]|uniref:Uncharacterized protein n=2 Tax=Emiliania huxleyi TaxID=2903 RepID=A0A0D3KDC0_EMIH1|nr:hypothetical protein EMIHUDRAFT_229246 [Emiliania huxleyi CCMP1516]EOD33755.1 hypothetical protein EMIHUDRAFT_229246 [Emiliania huxleyi CCMP1516]|eukprot:XP_005786184.1 hypothetical protein EMIHUDRAFT_229246 [Emiliania huxleyi CCMP1516]
MMKQAEAALAEDIRTPEWISLSMSDVPELVLQLSGGGSSPNLPETVAALREAAAAASEPAEKARRLLHVVARNAFALLGEQALRSLYQVVRSFRVNPLHKHKVSYYIFLWWSAMQREEAPRPSQMKHKPRL